MIRRLYHLLTRALPPRTQREDGEEIRRTFDDQLDDAGARRARVAIRALWGLGQVIVAEWWDVVRGRESIAAGRHRGTGRGRDGMRGWIAALRRTLRGLRRAPAFAGSTALLVALGVGSATAVFTIVDTVVLRGLPYPAGERLVYLTNGSHNGPLLERLDGVEAFESWTAVASASVNLSRDDGPPVRLSRAETTPSFFTLFGARPALGRLLTEADQGELGIAVLTHSAWERVWGGDPGVVGRTLRVDGTPIEVVGVLSADFVVPEALVSRDVAYFRPLDWANPNLENPGYHAHSVAARLTPDASLEVADRQIEGVVAEIVETYPDYYADGPFELPLADLRDHTVGEVRSGLLLLLGATGLLLLVACANIAHLFMARGLARGREVAIRRALGADRRRLVVGLGAESLLVGTVGGLGGLGLAAGLLRIFEGMTSGLPRAQSVSIDLRVLGFAIGLSTVTALLFGLLPAMRTMGRDVQQELRGGGRGITGGRAVQLLRNGLVVAEVALSLVLVAGAGVLMRSFLHVNAREPGVAAENIWMVPLTLPDAEEADVWRASMDEVLARVEAVPGVATASYGMEMPFQFVGGNACCWGTTATPPDAVGEDEGFRVSVHTYSPDYFETVGTPLVAGRSWTSAEAGEGEIPAVVSEELAIRFWGSAEAALGQPYDFFDGARVIGVAAPTLHYGLDQPHDFALYIPAEQLRFGIPIATVAVRFEREVADVPTQLREAIWSADPDLPIPTVTPVGDWIEASSETRRFGSLLLSLFGGLALLLAAAGLYGTLLYAVRQRRRELGIRMALGAGRGRIQRDVVRRGGALAGAGVVLGFLATLGLARFLESFVYGISSTDGVALTGAAALLIGVAVVASWLPAWRAARTDPLETLRAE